MFSAADRMRYDLIDLASKGQMSGEEAEARAKAAGIKPLATTPEFSKFDPKLRDRWTFAMSIAWIAWRDEHLLLEQQNDFREQRTCWFYREWNQPAGEGKKFEGREGWFLETLPRTNFSRLLLAHEYLRAKGELPSTSEYSPGEAERELVRGLAEAKVKAEGFDRNNKLVEIPAREWTRLQRFQERERDVFKHRALDQEQPYTEVLFRRDDLLREWPEADANSKSGVECRRWLIGLMRESPMRRTATKAELRKKARRQFNPLSVRQFNLAWDRAIEETGAVQWKKPGRTPTKSNQHTN